MVRNWNGRDVIPESGNGWGYFISSNWLGGAHGSAGGGSEPTKSQVVYVNGVVGDDPLLTVTDNKLSINTRTVGDVTSKSSVISAVRLHSNETFDNGLFIIDLDQIPHGRYFWPAFWLLGEVAPPNSWAMNGEIDIIEGGWNTYKRAMK